MDNKTKWLVAGFFYMLGVMGSFFVSVGEARKNTSSDIDAVGEAGLKALVWPLELLRMVL